MRVPLSVVGRKRPVSPADAPLEGRPPALMEADAPAPLVVRNAFLQREVERLERELGEAKRRRELVVQKHHNDSSPRTYSLVAVYTI